MAIFSFDREKREEAARIDKLRNSLEQVERVDLWDGASEERPTASAAADSFKDAIARRAKARGVAPQALFTNYVDQIRNSTYPTPQCLEPEEVQAVAASGPSTPVQSAHLQSCEACRLLVEASKPGEAELDALLTVVRQTPQDARTPKILVIDDEDHIRSVVGTLLGHKGYEVIEAKSGDEGIRVARQELPNLVLLDLQMPGTDGFQALRLLRDRLATQHIPVVAMANAGDAERTTAAGFDAHQEKPIEMNELMATVERLLQRG